MRTVLVMFLLSSSGCLNPHTITGGWAGCEPGDDIYISLATGTEGPEEADHFACERGQFEMGIPGESFTFELWVNGGRRVTTELEGITGDYDVGIFQL